MALLEVEPANPFFRTPGRLNRARGRRFAFHVSEGVTPRVWSAESGCVKSVITAKLILRLIPKPRAQLPESIRFRADLLQLDERALRDIRGNAISMIFPEPMTILTRCSRSGGHSVETLRRHQGLAKDARGERSIECSISSASRRRAVRLSSIPHHFSGGIAARDVAMALPAIRNC